MSRLMLAFHTLFFAGLVIGSFMSPFIAAFDPGAFKLYGPSIAVTIGVLILGSWYFYRGDCPFTVWENALRRREGRQTYSGSCIDRYAKKWFGLVLPRRFNTIFPVAILAIPLIAGFFV
ncbi:MAG: DUF2784 family protein [Candidatus Paceibacterota bacterium]